MLPACGMPYFSNGPVRLSSRQAGSNEEETYGFRIVGKRRDEGSRVRRSDRSPCANSGTQPKGPFSVEFEGGADLGGPGSIPHRLCASRDRPSIFPRCEGKFYDPPTRMNTVNFQFGSDPPFFEVVDIEPGVDPSVCGNDLRDISLEK